LTSLSQSVIISNIKPVRESSS